MTYDECIQNAKYIFNKDSRTTIEYYLIGVDKLSRFKLICQNKRSHFSEKIVRYDYDNFVGQFREAKNKDFIDEIKYLDIWWSSLYNFHNLDFERDIFKRQINYNDVNLFYTKKDLLTLSLKEVKENFIY